ncbi:hypothetical protein ACH4D5_36845 [Streptomyces sp. NPDC018029]|uniref:hypothetical protein n=1 Tax=Streptomyces sp. NPDC018029 TaxID=3365032 RepID=UPI00378E9283
MNHRTTTVTLLLSAALALTACSSGDDKADNEPKAEPSAGTELSQKQKKALADAAGIPPKPTGAEREKLLRALEAAAPDVVRYEDEAIDGARNQCAAINSKAQRLTWSAALRFTYRDVKTTKAQGAKINEALKKSGFCKV